MAFLNTNPFCIFKHSIVATLLIAFLASCAISKAGDNDASHSLPDTLRVATLYGPTSYFIYRDEPMGYDYSLVSNLATEKGMALDLKIASSLPQAIAMLDSGSVDLIAYEVPITLDNKERMLHCGPESETSQVLVQPKKGGEGYISDVTQLVGRDVYVVDDSKYLQRMLNLNEELGGGVKIHTVDGDTIITEDLIDMVSDGKIPLTVVDSDIARINKTYYPDLDISLQVSFPQRSAWAVAKDMQWLADSIDVWLDSPEPRQKNDLLLKRYFELNKLAHPEFNVDLSKGKLSEYDALFKRYAKEIGWDWRLLAAQSFVESRFMNGVESWSGAQGIMQIMPATAVQMGEDPAKLTEPEVSIRTASKVLAILIKSFDRKVSDKDERVKFVVAAYNCGPGHIYDAINLARLTGKNPEVWEGNVEEALKLKSNPKYYNDPVVKNGYFRYLQTTNYVNEVFHFYDKVSEKIHS